MKLRLLNQNLSNKVEEKNDELGMFMVFVLLFFGALFLIIDLIGEIKGLF
jgi:hypothetical protein